MTRLASIVRLFFPTRILIVVRGPMVRLMFRDYKQVGIQWRTVENITIRALARPVTRDLVETRRRSYNKVRRPHDTSSAGARICVKAVVHDGGHIVTASDSIE
jgi:hypothetical protein